ncbi:MAG: hypothetical protein D3926_02940, partial [Desulfobacteraceae bacterium]
TMIQQINPATGTVTGTSITGPLNPNRALAYDPVTDHFWTGGFGTDIYEINRSGTVINQYSNANGIYGMAWDSHTAGGPWLWVWSQDGSGTVCSQFDPSSGSYTGVTYYGVNPPGGIAGGAAFERIGADFLFIGLHQADPIDYIVGYRFPGDMNVVNPAQFLLLLLE